LPYVIGPEESGVAADALSQARQRVSRRDQVVQAGAKQIVPGSRFGSPWLHRKICKFSKVRRSETRIPDRPNITIF
jgi:hypothetical protein